MLKIFKNLKKGISVKIRSTNDLQESFSKSNALVVSNTITLMSLSVITITAIYLPYLYYKHGFSASICHLFHFNIISLSFVLWLNNKNFLLIAGILFYLIESYFLTSVSLIQGRSTYFHIYLLTGFMISPFMFTEKHKNIRNFLYFLFSLSFVALEFHFNQYTVESMMNVIGLCFLIFSFSTLIFKINQSDKKKIEYLIYNTLPEDVIKELKEEGKVKTKSYKDVVILVTDIVGFTEKSSQIKPKILIEELNSMFSTFDHLIEKYGGNRIKTIGDAYMASFGMDSENSKDLKENVNKAVIACQKMIRSINKINFQTKHKWEIRAGIHYGEVIGGIIGEKKYIFDIFGNTVNTAFRLETSSRPMKINMTQETFNMIKNYYEGEKDQKDLKGLGLIDTIMIDANLDQSDETTILFLKDKAS